MAKLRTDDSRYESKYGGGYVSPAQYIAEMVCERIAKKNKKDLPIKFWSTAAWKRSFLTNVLAANSLLKLYQPKAIIAALRKAYNVYSLRAPWLDDLFKEEQEKLDNLKTVEDTPSPSPADVVVSTEEKPRESFTTKESPLKKLRGLDG